jgi:hypothetical protein
MPLFTTDSSPIPTYGTDSYPDSHLHSPIGLLRSVCAHAHACGLRTFTTVTHSSTACAHSVSPRAAGASVHAQSRTRARPGAGTLAAPVGVALSRRLAGGMKLGSKLPPPPPPPPTPPPGYASFGAGFAFKTRSPFQAFWGGCAAAAARAGCYRWGAGAGGRCARHRPRGSGATRARTAH